MKNHKKCNSELSKASSSGCAWLPSRGAEPLFPLIILHISLICLPEDENAVINLRYGTYSVAAFGHRRPYRRGVDDLHLPATYQVRY